MKAKNILKKIAKSRYITSFKNIKILKGSLFYIGFLAVSYILLQMLNYLTKRLKIEELLTMQTPQFQDELAMLLQSAGYLDLMKQRITFLIIYFILFFIFIIANWSVFEGLVWNLIYKKKYSTKQFLRFFLFNILFFLAVLLLLLLVAASVKGNLASWFLLSILILAIYFRLACYIAFFKTKKSTEAVKLGWKIAILKIHRFLPFFLLAAFTMFIFLGIIGKITLPISQTAVNIGFLIWFIIATPWSKFYLKSVADRIK